MADPTPGCGPGEHAHASRAVALPDAATLERAAGLFRALGDAPRLRLLSLLADGEWCVTELVEHLKEKFSTVSQRLGLLRAAHLVVRRRQGTHVYYVLADRHVVSLIREALEHVAEPGSESEPEKE